MQPHVARAVQGSPGQSRAETLDVHAGMHIWPGGIPQDGQGASPAARTAARRLEDTNARSPELKPNCLTCARHAFDLTQDRQQVRTLDVREGSQQHRGPSHLLLYKLVQQR